ncbi:hypothetical protein [Sphingobium sp. CFD-1]|uniref:hypothetical protein n=1 Tax=Sphingobium sp. CFD-1 TaxID=2878545 RepID=UPI00214C1033|nr:hypothetical protein [Sphingobium sp. CFD-1]
MWSTQYLDPVEVHEVRAGAVHRLALPALRAPDGTWSVLDESEIRRQGFTQTARRFAAINQKLKAIGKGKSL